MTSIQFELSSFFFFSLTPLKPTRLKAAPPLLLSMFGLDLGGRIVDLCLSLYWYSLENRRILLCLFYFLSHMTSVW